MTYCKWIIEPDTERRIYKCYPDEWGWPTTQPKGEHRTGSYGSTSGYVGTHNGIDLGIGTGNKILAPHNGVVTFAGWNNQGYGNLVIIAFEEFKIYLAHLSQINVRAGQRVAIGDVVGLSGSTGNSTGPHLHYEVRKGNSAIDPDQFYKGGVKPGTPGNPGVAQQSSFVLANYVNGTLKPSQSGTVLAKKDPSGNLMEYHGKAGDKCWPPVCEDYEKATIPAVKRALGLVCQAAVAACELKENITGGDPNDNEKCGIGEIDCYIQNALRDSGTRLAGVIGFPLDPEDRTNYAIRWIVGILGVVLLFFVIKAIMATDPVTLVSNPPAWVAKQAVKHPKIAFATQYRMIRDVKRGSSFYGDLAKGKSLKQAYADAKRIKT